MPKVFNRALQVAGEKVKVGTPVVNEVILDGSGMLLLATGATVPTNGDAGYAKGCIFMDTDAAAASIFFVNEGTSSSCDFNAVNPTASNTAWDAIGDATANGTIALAGYTTIWTTSLNGGMIFRIQNTVADLTVDTIGLGIDLNDDGDANGIFLRFRDNAYADTVFSVGANGLTTIAGSAKNTDALVLTAGDILLTSGHLDMSDGNLTVAAGTINIAADSQNLTLGASGSTDSYIVFDGTNLKFYDSALGSTRTLTQLAGGGLVNPTITGDVTISDGKFTWTDLVAEAAGVWTFNGTTTSDIAISSAINTGKVLAITANSITSGVGVYVESSAAGMTTGYFFEGNNGAATVFSVGLYGAVVIAGNASTDVLTITAGDLQITAGDIDIDLGFLAVDNTADEQNYIARNNAVGTNAVLKVLQDHATGGVALLIDQDSTTTAHYALEIDSEGGTGIHFLNNVAAGVAIHLDVADSYTARAIYLDLGPWLGTTSQGAITIVTDAAATIPAGQLLRLDQNGTGQHAGAINGSVLFVDDQAAAPGAGTSYAVYINAANIGALYVDSGAVQFDGNVTVGVDGTGADVKFFGDTASKFIVWDQSQDKCILADSTYFQFGGDESTNDGVIMSFDGTSTFEMYALTANDAIVIGSTTDTDFIIHTTAGAALTVDSSANSFVLGASQYMKFTGSGTGKGLMIPIHASNSPSQQDEAGGGNIFFEVDANKLWVYNGTGWVGVTLA